MWPLYKNGPSTTSVNTVPTATDTNTINVPTYQFDKNTILQTIKDTSSGDTSLVILNITDKTTGALITNNAIFTLINARVLIDFKQSVTGAVIGGYRGEPWMAFSITDLSTSFGGMLDWEKTISSDLSPWFGPTISQTRTGVLTNFTDQVIEKIDVRVLKDSSGNEKIVYGFINQNKLLITTNSTAFLNIAHNLNSQ